MKKLKWTGRVTYTMPDGTEYHFDGRQPTVIASEEHLNMLKDFGGDVFEKTEKGNLKYVGNVTAITKVSDKKYHCDKEGIIFIDDADELLDGSGFEVEE